MCINQDFDQFINTVIYGSKSKTKL